MLPAWRIICVGNLACPVQSTVRIAVYKLPISYLHGMTTTFPKSNCDSNSQIHVYSVKVLYAIIE